MLPDSGGNIQQLREDRYQEKVMPHRDDNQDERDNAAVDFLVF